MICDIGQVKSSQVAFNKERDTRTIVHIA